MNEQNGTPSLAATLISIVGGAFLCGLALGMLMFSHR
jgi:hypothetical protein